MSEPGSLAPPPPRPARALAQAVGFLIGLALLGWCASVALSEKNRAQLERLRDASWTDVALLVLLSLASLGVNSAIFWAAVRPVRRVPLASAVPVNLVATTLAYLPFKLSLIFRAAVHHRRDSLPVLTVGAWIAGVGVVMLAVIAPALAASTWRTQVDALWWATAGGGALASCLALIVVARLFARQRAWIALERFVLGADPARGGWHRLLNRSRLLPRIHEGVRMLADPGAVLAGGALRAVDVGLQSARFLVAARLTGYALPPDQAVAAAAAYFVIGVLSPTGMLGFREIGVFALIQSESFALVVLPISAIEMLVNLSCAIPAALYLRGKPRTPRTQPVSEQTPLAPNDPESARREQSPGAS